MKESNLKIIKDDTVFQTAKENMDYDAHLIQHLQENTRIERQYRWQLPSITISYKQECLPELIHLDHAKRVTGGGIVFHSPGDIVFSIAFWDSDTVYTGTIKNKLAILAKKIQHKLTASGVDIDQKANPSPINYERCSQYPTPFEIMVKGKKICGLTIRKFRERYLIQGILHTENSHNAFLPFTCINERFSSLGAEFDYLF